MNSQRIVPMQVSPNTSLNRTRNGVPRLGLISFWPRRVTPLRAGYLERYASQTHNWSLTCYLARHSLSHSWANRSLV